jgi:hypothetical protein
MVFPGVLRGRPGPRLATIHTSRPRRSLSSPWMYYQASVAPRLQAPNAHAWGRTVSEHAQIDLPVDPVSRSPEADNIVSLNEVDAVPGRFEEPATSRPEGFPVAGGAALHLSGLALCGSGAASTSNVRLLRAAVKSSRAVPPHIPKK